MFFRTLCDHISACAGPTIGAWLLACPNIPLFHLSFAHFFTTLCIRFGIPHLTIPHLSQCQCGHTIDDPGIHL
jgi:hypothetical protein